MFKVIGFNFDERIVFMVEEKYIILSNDLPKIRMIIDLKMKSRMICDEVRDAILDDANEKGFVQFVYSDDEKEWNNDQFIKIDANHCRYKRFKKTVPLESNENCV